MIIVIAIVTALIAITVWNNYIENPKLIDANIPPSKNISFNTKRINHLTPNDLVNEIDNAYGKPVLLFLYTSWCQICKKQLPIVNEMARKFQSTELVVMAIAIDKNITDQTLSAYLDSYNHIYFKPNYLIHNDGLSDLLSKKSIEYNNRIPLTVVIARDGKIISRFIGYKSENYLNNKLVKAISDN